MNYATHAQKVGTFSANLRHVVGTNAFSFKATGQTILQKAFSLRDSKILLGPCANIKQSLTNNSGISWARTNNFHSKSLFLNKALVVGNPVICQFKRSNKASRDKMSNSEGEKPSSTELTIRKRYRPRERTFKTPYGEIACLEWGRPEAPKKVLCVHGWLDNAGSFERLVPFILDADGNDEKYHVLAMDMPGVGHSSHRPPGADYTTFSFVMEMRRVAQQSKWEKFTLISHSLGAHLSYMYSCIYPDQVDSMVSIDLAHPLTRQVNNWNITIANSIEDHFKCEYHHEDDPTTNIRVPVYSETDAIKRLMDGHSSSLTRESAETLLKRGAKKQRWGFTFNRDVRLRHLSLEMRPDDDLMLRFLQNPFKPNLLIIRANRSPYHRPEEVRLKYYELFKRNCPIFRDVMLDGTHHLHMNSPDLVAPEINKFLREVHALQNGGSDEQVFGETKTQMRPSRNRLRASAHNYRQTKMGAENARVLHNACSFSATRAT